MAEDLGKRAEKYAREMKKVASEAQKGIETAAKEMDRIGRRMYDDVREGAKDPGNSVNNVVVRMREDINREIPNIIDEMKRLEKRMEKYMEEVQDEIRKL